MLKKILIALGVVLAFILTMIGAGILFAIIDGPSVMNQGKVYANYVLPKLLENTSRTNVLGYMCEKARKVVTTEQLDSVGKVLDKLGAVQKFELGEPSWFLYGFGEQPSVVTFLLQAEFDGGPAEIQLVLNDVSGKWCVNGFRVTAKSPPHHPSTKT
jgi:hypothetical protein